jgi:hypothetical protein
MALFGWGLQKERAAQQPSLDGAIGDLFDPAAFLRALDQIVPRYLDSVDRHELIYPACTRKVTDVQGDVRSIWHHTRVEAMRYLVMVPGRESELLIGPARQPEMTAAFLRQLPHENTVIDFTGVATENLGIAIIAGFNWLSHCASRAGVHPEKFARTLTSFRKVVRLAQQWWDAEGAGLRYQQMLTERERPPLMLYLVWSEYTRLAKEIASAAIYGSSIERSIEKDREQLAQKLTGQPAELKTALAALTETMNRLEAAEDPEDLGKPQPASG